jgi:hypothetical protein
LFDRSFAETLFDSVLEARTATVLSESGRPTTRAPPLPLNTLEMQKRLNRAIRVSPDAIMKMAEELYQAGFISYPRTETDAFPNDFDYRTAIDDLCGHNSFGFHAQALAGGRFNRPRAGGNNDNAHPPIYPTKLMSSPNTRRGAAKTPTLPKVYEFVCRHFLACCSLPAVAHKTAVEAEMGGERFRATGLMIKEMNYLDVYGKGPAGGPRLEPSYDSWAGNTLPTYVVGQRFEPTELRLDESATAAPPLLSEVDLLQKMENHGIGTDATQATHIEKVVGERGYAVKVGDNRLKPTELGEGLVAGYSRSGLDDMWLPHKRAETEADVNRVATGAMPVDVAKKNTTTAALAAFRELERRKHTLVDAVREFTSRRDADGVHGRDRRDGHENDHENDHGQRRDGGQEATAGRVAREGSRVFGVRRRRGSVSPRRRYIGRRPLELFPRRVRWVRFVSLPPARRRAGGGRGRGPRVREPGVRGPPGGTRPRGGAAHARAAPAAAVRRAAALERVPVLRPAARRATRVPGGRAAGRRRRARRRRRVAGAREEPGASDRAVAAGERRRPRPLARARRRRVLVRRSRGPRARRARPRGARRTGRAWRWRSRRVLQVQPSGTLGEPVSERVDELGFDE